jgi:hypothetical protein
MEAVVRWSAVKSDATAMRCAPVVKGGSRFQHAVSESGFLADWIDGGHVVRTTRLLAGPNGKNGALSEVVPFRFVGVDIAAGNTNGDHHASKAVEAGRGGAKAKAVEAGRGGAKAKKAGRDGAKAKAVEAGRRVAEAKAAEEARRVKPKPAEDAPRVAKSKAAEGTPDKRPQEMATSPADLRLIKGIVTKPTRTASQKSTAPRMRAK